MKRLFPLLIPLVCCFSAVALGQGPAGEPPPPYLSEQELVGTTAFSFLEGRTLDIVLPKEGMFSAEEVFTLEGVLVGEDGSPAPGVSVFFFTLDKNRAPVIYRALDKEAEARSGPESQRVYNTFMGDRRVILNPRVKSDAKGRFKFRLGPAWQAFDSATIGFLLTGPEGSLPGVAILMAPIAPGGGVAIPVTQEQRNLKMGRIVVKGQPKATGAAPGAGAAQKQEGTPAWVPKYPRISKVVGTENNVTSFIVRDSPSAVLGYYEAELKKGGFSVSRGLNIMEGNTLAMGSLDGHKEERKVSVVAAGVGKGQTQVEVSWETAPNQ